MKTVLPLFALLSPDGKNFLPSGSSTSDAELMRKDWTTIGTKEK